MEKTVYLTREGFAKLEEELNHLRTVRRHEVAERIRKAKEFTNTVDNAEYEDAKNEQSFVEGKIQSLERMLANAVVIDDKAAPSGYVRVGSHVTVTDSDGIEESYAIVGSAEADPRQGRISNESPIGRALLGKKVGETVSVMAPGGAFDLVIKSVS
ncbi:MAG TPA: transcription elongation factor GreA [Chloroflexota bacterium]|nr:transcription elongation factor GreA [Chloroflexota bacterium]HEX2987372.1 transcription elongation factor GreA [Chloroflexota bacterium]